MNLSRIRSSFGRFDDAKIPMPNWVVSAIAGVVCWGLGIFWKFPEGFLSTTHFPRLADFLALCADPLNRDLVEPFLAYRISVPVIAWLFQLPPEVAAVIQYLFLIAALAVTFHALVPLVRRSVAFLSCWLLAMTFLAHWSNRWLGYPDSFSHLCAALALLTTSPVALALLTLLGMMNDERFAFAIPLVVLWHGFVRTAATERRALWRSALGLSIGVAATGVFRLALTHGWIGPGIEKPAIYTAITPFGIGSSYPYDSTAALFFINLAMGFQWVWILPLFAIKYLWGQDQVKLAVGLAVWLACCSFAAGLVADVSRSIGFLFPAAVLGVVALSRSRIGHRRLLCVLLAGMIVTPTFYYCGRSGAVLVPYPMEVGSYLIKKRTGRGVLESIKPWFRPARTGGVAPK